MDIGAARAVFPVQYGYEMITFYHHNSTHNPAIMQYHTMVEG